MNFPVAKEFLPSSKPERDTACCTPGQPSTCQISTTPLVEAEGLRLAGGATDEMVKLEGGVFWMGSDDPEGFPADGEGPVREITLSGFYIDAHPVTNREFSEFVKASGYFTESEQLGWSFVFAGHIPAEQFGVLVQATVPGASWWCQVYGADWTHPAGPDSSIAGRLDHPVVHVSWHDAQAYCAWAGKRLPTEAEWEYAARGGLVQAVYAWGNELQPAGKHRCNIWQGNFPVLDLAEDGYAGTSPVQAFPPNGFGLYDMAGNTWEWCADWFHPTHHAAAARVNPHGPSSGSAKVIRGGSYLCHWSYCNRYRVAARTSNTPESAATNISFRCVRDL
jgi:formylglycine-generating enzyme required for sulfatase activity